MRVDRISGDCAWCAEAIMFGKTIHWCLYAVLPMLFMLFIYLIRELSTCKPSYNRCG